MEKLLKLIDGPSLTLCNFSIKEMPPKEERPKDIEGELLVEFEINEDAKRVVFSLSANMSSDAVPFSFLITMRALFKFLSDKNNDSIKKMVTDEGITAIFPELKRFVADLTETAGYRPFELPEPGTTKKPASKTRKKKN